MGIIGGADGPTVVFLAGDIGGTIALLLGSALLAALIVFLVIRKKKNR